MGSVAVTLVNVDGVPLQFPIGEDCSSKTCGDFFLRK